MELPVKQKGTRVPKMRTRAKMWVVASDRARRENVPRHILLYISAAFEVLTGSGST